MKIRILIKENLDKIYNILPIIKENDFLTQNVKNIEYFNENNWPKVFEKVEKEIKNNEFERVCIFDEDGMLPFIFFSKRIGFTATVPFDVKRSNLSRSHNNSNCIIIATKYVQQNNINEILNEFFITKSEGGRHATRVALMQQPFKETKTIFAFNESKKDTIVICSDHAGYILKEEIKKYLILEKNMNVIDVGCSSSNSCHYPLFAIAMIGNAPKACCGIAVCSTGVGIANTSNKFKGINAAICAVPGQAKLARNKYNANVLALGANNIEEKTAKLLVDEFIKTSRGKSEFMLPMEKYGYAFDFEKFKKIPLGGNIEIPKELIK